MTWNCALADTCRTWGNIASNDLCSIVGCIQKEWWKRVKYLSDCEIYSPHAVQYKFSFSVLLQVSSLRKVSSIMLSILLQGLKKAMPTSYQYIHIRLLGICIRIKTFRKYLSNINVNPGGLHIFFVGFPFFPDGSVIKALGSKVGRKSSFQNPGHSMVCPSTSRARHNENVSRS